MESFQSYPGHVIFKYKVYLNPFNVLFRTQKLKEIFVCLAGFEPARTKVQRNLSPPP